MTLTTRASTLPGTGRSAGSSRREPARSVLEREARFAPPPGFVLPDFTGVLDGAVSGPGHEHRRDSLYFDTAHADLADAGITIRRDRVAGGYDWLLDLTDEPSEPFPIRRTLHFDRGGKAVPDGVVHHLATHHRPHRLVPVAAVSGIATVVALLLPGTVRLGELVDERTHVRHGETASSRRQIAVTTPVLNHPGLELLRRISDGLTAAGCRLETSTGDVFRFTVDA